MTDRLPPPLCSLTPAYQEAVLAYAAARVAAALASETEPNCAWSQDGEDTDTWASGCGHLFCITADTPAENGMRYCCFCGWKLSQHQWEDEDEHA